MKINRWILLVTGLALMQTAVAQDTVADRWLSFEGRNAPRLVGHRVAERFAGSAHFNYGRPGPPKYIYYPEACTWYGALTYARTSGDTAMARRLTERFEPLFSVDAAMVPPAVHVDYTVFGIIPFELAIQTHEPRYLEMARHSADAQWQIDAAEDPPAEARAFAADGLSWQTRMWIDDMYMITMVQVQAYRATHEPGYIEHAAREMAVYLDSLQRPNGLFYHAPDVPFYWGRGNGWVAAGMTELLLSLPRDNPYYDRIMRGYHKMMAALLRYQTKEGMWRQLIDDKDSWPETSGTGMFAFAIISGVKNGWLPPERYGPAARKAWLSLVGYLDDHSDMREVCEGTNKKNDRQYYLDRRRVVGDLHGQAPVLWCVTALLR